MRFRNLLAIVTSILVIGIFTACSAGQQQVSFDYTEITTRITNYEDAYRSFVNSGEGEVAMVTATGVTPLGASCSSKYTVSSDGAYESCSLVVQREVEQYDEYFNIGDGLMMFVRTYVDPDGVPHISKYISTGTAVFFINDLTHTVDPVEDITALDCFVTFDQVRRVYAGTPDEANETQLAA